MQSEEITTNETSTPTENKNTGKRTPVINIDESDYVGRFVFYIFVAIVVLGFTSMVGMGLFAFYFGV